MRPGTLIMAACLALVSCLRFTEQAYGLAALFAVLALGALALGARPGRTASPPPAEFPSAGSVKAAWATHARNARTWRAIALFGFAASAVGAFVFPPMALVVAGLSVYAVHRMRQSRQSTYLLGKVTD